MAQRRSHRAGRSGSSFSAHLPSIADSPHIRGNGEIPSQKAEGSGQTDARQGGAAGRQTDSGYAGENPQSWNRPRHGGHGVGHGIAAAARQFVGPPARFLGGPQGTQVDAPGIQRGSATRLYGVAHHGPRSAIGQRAGPWRRRGRARACAQQRGLEISPAARRSADAAGRLRRHREPAVARSAAARGPAGIFLGSVDAAPSAATGEIRRRHSLQDRFRFRAEGRPAAGDQGTGGGRKPHRSHAGAARRHRLGQDFHDGEGDRGDAAPRPHPRAQQDAGCPALRGVQVVLSRQRGRVFRFLLRLLPARSLRSAHRHLHREGILDQRADRPHAPLGDARAARARRRNYRRLGVVHLRHRLGGNVFGDDVLAQARRQDRPAPAARRSRGVAVQAHAGRFLPRLIPRARRHGRYFPGAL